MLTDKSMKAVAHSVKSLIGKSHHSLRCLKTLTGIYTIFKGVGIYALNKARLIKAAYLHAFIVIAAIYEVKAVAVTLILIGPGP